MQLEIIQPVYGPTIYEAFIEQHGEGRHHIEERIHDESTDAVLQEYRDKGIGVLPTGQFDVDFHYYLNTEPKLDFIYELGNCPKLDLPVGPVLDLPARKGLSSLTDSPNEEASLEEGSDGRLASEPRAMSHF